MHITRPRIARSEKSKRHEPFAVRARRHGWAFVLIIMLMVSVPSCRRVNQSNVKPRYGGQITIPVFGTVLSRSALDPAAPSFPPIAGTIYEGLTHRNLDAKDETEPALAESWETTPDGLTWKFHLRRGVRFHDDGCFAGGVGRELVAADFIYSWERLFKSETLPAAFNSFGRFIEGARDVRENRKPHASGLRAVDPYTLEVRLVMPFISFLRATSWMPTSVVPHEAVELYGARFAEHPVGTGAFRFVEWDVDQRVVVARHPHYWKQDADGNQLPYLDSIKYQAFGSLLTAFQSLGSGVSHMSPVPGNLEPDVLENSDVKDDLRLRGQYAARGLQAFRVLPPASAFYLCFQMERATPFTRDARLRRAVAYAVQKENATDAPPQHVLLSSLQDAPASADVGGFTHDMRQAEELLSEAGHPHGRGLPKLRLMTFPGVREQNRAAIKNLLALGLEIEEKVISLNDKERELRAGDYDMFMETWDFYYRDVSAQVTRFLSDAPFEENAAHYRNSQLDDSINHINTARDPTERLAAVAEVEKLLLREAVWVTFAEAAFQARTLVLLRGEVHVDAPTAARLKLNLDLRKLWLTEPVASSGATIPIAP